MNEDWFEKTAQYLNDEMSAEERLSFESEMKVNDELFSYLNLYKTIETEMQNEKKFSEPGEALKRSLKKLNSIYFDKKTSDTDIVNTHKQFPVFNLPSTKKSQQQNNKLRTINIWKILAVAAVTIGIIALSMVLYLQSSKKNAPVVVNKIQTDTGLHSIKPGTAHLQKNIPSPNIITQNNIDSNAAEIKQPHTLDKKTQEALFVNNFKPDATPAVKEGPLEDAFNYYDDHAYAAAAAEFSSANLNSATRGLETDPKLTAFYANYYAGLSYLAAGHTGNATSELENAINKSPETLLQTKAEWYLSLAYLKTGDIQKTNELLTKISANNKSTAFRLKAIKLLNELK